MKNEVTWFDRPVHVFFFTHKAAAEQMRIYVKRHTPWMGIQTAYLSYLPVTRVSNPLTANLTLGALAYLFNTEDIENKSEIN